MDAKKLYTHTVTIVKEPFKIKFFKRHSLQDFLYRRRLTIPEPQVIRHRSFISFLTTGIFLPSSILTAGAAENV